MTIEHQTLRENQTVTNLRYIKEINLNLFGNKMFK